MNRLALPSCAALLSASMSVCCLCAPVELDTADTHIIVVRPVDIWSGDRSAQSDSLDHVESRTALYWLWIGPNNFANGGPLWLQRISDHPMVTAATAEMRKAGFSAGLSQSYGFRVQPPEPLEPGRFEDFAKAQASHYKLVTLSQGDPDTLPGRILGKKFFGGLLSLATLGVAGSTFGAIGAETVLNTGLAGDVYQLPLYLRDSLSPAILPRFDASPYKQIDLRAVLYRGAMNGQILIAYKTDKTEAAELEAMGMAIAAAAGVGTTVAEVEKSRAEDLAYRKATWDTCVATGDCKDGVYAPQAK